ncbi:LuxR C-terminal-related transcriptional regulator [Sphaerisporangium aureirubrum]|uniref:LuxR C-terminal-related transcriptional regulator n=1 Tax=Sphaerisporangium aureirubrum TaxID=1544736 RepID=A0ABW1NTK8_9ACTN
MFEVFGLSGTAESVYLAMLQNPEEDLDGLARTLSLDIGELRGALDDLARVSLVRASSDRQSLRAVSPEIGLSVLLARHEAEMARRQQAVEQCRAAVTEFLAEWSESRAKGPELGAERLEGIDTIRDRLKDLADRCEWEACSFMPGGAQSPEGLAASRVLDAEAIGRGVHLRTVYLDSVRNDQATLDYAGWLSGLGSEVRTVPALPIRMLIVDRKAAVVPIDPEGTAGVAMLISSPGVVAGLMALFNAIWKSASPLGVARRRDEEGLSAQERQVLILLADGYTDEVIARRLGVSVRTARRVASDLLTRLAARSRFQAGARAVLRGWIDSDDLT